MNAYSDAIYFKGISLNWLYIARVLLSLAAERNTVNINQLYTKHSTNQFNILFKISVVFHILLSVNLHQYSLWFIADFSIALLKMINVSGKPLYCILCRDWQEISTQWQFGNACTPQSCRLGERSLFSFHIYSIQKWRTSQTEQNDGMLTQTLKEVLTDDLTLLQL